ncbi:MAG: hypothetical protein WBG23_01590 [Acidobacteriaceae bacterium]
MIHTEKHSETVSTGQKAALLLLYSLLVALRDPWLLLHGRLWAEEGTVYLRSAWSSGVSATLFSPHLGYYALWPNFCSLLAAHVFPLQYAALVDTWCSFFIQVFAGWLLLQCEAFSSIRIKSFALLVLLLAAPSRQVWLNSINSQFYLVVCAVIVFLSRSDRRQLMRNFALALAGMTGPVTTFLTPFFLLRALFAKTRSAYVQAAVLTTCACTQILVIRESLHAGVRHINFQPSGIAPEYLVEYIVMPFFGRTSKKLALSVILNQMGAYVSTAQTSLGHFKTLVMSYHLPLTWPFLLLWAVVDIAFLALLLWATYDRADRSSWWLLIMSIWLALFSIYGAVGGTYAVGERYVFPSVLLMGLALLLAAARTTTAHTRKVVATFLLACFLLAGAFDYFSYPQWVGWEKPAGPTWSTQVQMWRQDPSRRLSVWPPEFHGDFTLPPDHGQTKMIQDSTTPPGAR